MQYNPTLLVVDDDPAVPMNMKIWFENRSCTVHTASTCEDALKILDGNDIDILITDYQLPDMTGTELIRLGRRIRYDLQCMMITGYPDIEVAIDAMKAGAINYIRKPLKMMDLSIAVDEAVERLRTIQNLRTKILLVEDAKAIRRLESKMLKDTGFRNIIEADDGEEAVRILEAQDDVGLIISDWNMPNKTGLELLEWLRAHPKYKRIPFIMATAQGEKKQVVRAIKAGANNYIIKPFGRRDLKTAIEETLPIINDTETSVSREQRLKQKTVSGKTIINVAHIPITDHLVLGALKHLIDSKQVSPKYFELKTQRMLLWNPVQMAIERGEVDAVFILAPIGMDLYSFGIPIKLILLSHKNGSICVRNKHTEYANAQEIRDFFMNKKFYLPHLLSVHHMLSHQYFSKLGMTPGLTDNKDANIFYEVIPPIIMPDLQSKDKDVGGFMVAEPIGTKAIHDNIGELMFLSSELWMDHPCCAVIMRDDFIKANTDAVYEFTSLLVKAGKFIAEDPKYASKVGVEFLDPDQKIGLTPLMLEKVLKDHSSIKTDDLYPDIADLDRIQKYMCENIGFGTRIDMEKFVDSRFADLACKK